MNAFSRGREELLIVQSASVARLVDFALAGVDRFCQRYQNMLLDMLDRQIEQEHLSKAVLERVDPQQTAGFAAPLKAYVSKAHREKFVQAMQPAAKPMNVQVVSNNTTQPA